MRGILALVFAFLLIPMASQAQEEAGDVCNIRPDLCDEGGGTPEPDIPPPVAPTRIKRPAPKVQPRKVRPVRKPSKRKAATNCRVAGQPFNLDQVDLPICGSSAAKPEPEKEIEKSQEITFEDLMPPEEQEKPVRRTARRAPAAISFDSYMHANANHPAIANKRTRERQKAFQDQVKPAALSISSVEDGTGMRENSPAPAESSATAGNTPVSPQ